MPVEADQRLSIFYVAVEHAKSFLLKSIDIIC